MTELDQLVEGLDRINIMCDRVLIKLEGKHIPVVVMSNTGHSCDDPSTCKLNTTDNPYWCMQVQDTNDREVNDD